MNDDAALHRSLHAAQLELQARLLRDHPNGVRALEEDVYPGYRFPWRVAEAPALLPREVFDRDVAAMRQLLGPYFTPAFRSRYQADCPERYRRPDDNGWFPRFIATDFSRVFDVATQRFRWCVPEIQSFPGNLILKPLMVRSLLRRIPEWDRSVVSLHSDRPDFEGYLERLKLHVLRGHAPKDTIILEIAPLEQKTVVDMFLWVKHLGVRLVDLKSLSIDPGSGEAVYSEAFVFEGGVPILKTFGTAQVARNILCRCLPDEMDEALSKDALPLGASGLRALFQGTIERRSADWIVHPQDFFVLSKASLVGNPFQDPPLERLTEDLVNRFAREKRDLSRGVLKPSSSAGGKGLLGFAGIPSIEDLRRLATDSRAQWLYQEKYSPDFFDRRAIVGFQPTSDEEALPLYHELRLMWAATPRTGSSHEVDLQLLTAMTRWSRQGLPANAGYATTPFTGTHGMVVR